MRKGKEWLLLIVMVLSMLASGCGNAKGEKEGETTQSETEQESRELVSEPDTVREDENSSTEEEEILAEFVSMDGTITIMLPQRWITRDMGGSELARGSLMVRSMLGQEFVMITQLPKGDNSQEEASLEEIKEFFPETARIGDYTGAAVPKIPGVEGLDAYTGVVEQEGEEGEAYFVYGETEYAYYVFMAKNKTVDEADIAIYQEYFSTFKENENAITATIPGSETDTVLWFNAIGAVLTHLNEWDYTIFGGTPVDSNSIYVMQVLLDEWWGVTDRETADETMQWLMEEGHRTSLIEELQYLEEEGLGVVAPEDRADFIYQSWDISRGLAEAYAKCYTFYEAGETDMIAAWDYSRAMNLLGWYYVAGYYTRQEALDASLELAKEIQNKFGSWDEFMESYFLGYEYWAEESSDGRRETYEMLKGLENGPYSLDWNLVLEKSW